MFEVKIHLNKLCVGRPSTSFDIPSFQAGVIATNLNLTVLFDISRRVNRLYVEEKLTFPLIWGVIPVFFVPCGFMSFV